jgi:hypothetical protein
VVAGTILTAAVMTDVDPLLKWSLAVIAGGGMAGMVQAKTVMTRGVSTATTAGLANPVVATVELGGAVTTALVSVVMPLVAFAMVFGLLVWMLRGKVVRNAPSQPTVSGQPT